MTPKEAVREILDKVENVTGYPVTVVENPQLSVLATAKSANSRIPFTAIQVRPDSFGTKEYLIAYQCGFILRVLDNSSKPWDIAYTDVGVNESLEGWLLPESSAKQQLGEHFLKSLIVQLRSMPVGLRIDEWIRDSFPCLHQQQDKSAERQLNENLTVFAPQIKQLAPPKIYSANTAMNAAHALFWARFWNDGKFSTPYRVAALESKGLRLLNFYDAIDHSATHDKLLIDRWAEDLQMTGWYEFHERED